MLRQLNHVELLLPHQPRLGVTLLHALQLDGLQLHHTVLLPDLIHLLIVATLFSAVVLDGRSLGKLQ